MRGKHQRQNVSLAVMALSLLEDKYQIDWQQAEKGITETAIPGRFEQLGEHSPIVIDGAHNVAGIQSFIQTVLQYYPDCMRYLLFAGFHDKELTKMVQELIPYFTTIYLTSFDHPRAINAETLYRSMDYHDTLIVHEDWQEMVKHQAGSEQAEDTVLFVTGSLNFILEVRRYFLNHFSS